MSSTSEKKKRNRWAECTRCGTKIILTNHILELEGIESEDLTVGAVLPLQLGCDRCGGIIATYRVTALGSKDG